MTVSSFVGDTVDISLPSTFGATTVDTSAAVTTFVVASGPGMPVLIRKVLVPPVPDYVRLDMNDTQVLGVGRFYFEAQYDDGPTGDTATVLTGFLSLQPDTV